jgi:hypothetical protein
MANPPAMTMVTVSAANRAAVAAVMMMLHELRGAPALRKLERRANGRSLGGGDRNTEAEGCGSDS